MAVMVGALLMITIFILIYLVLKRKRERKLDEWRDQLSGTLQRAIFFEAGENTQTAIPLTFRTLRGLKHPGFRQLLIDELVRGKKSLTGTAATNLVLLFNQLGLSRLSLQKLNNRRWHIKARGIQELAVMEQRQLVTRIYRLTNAHHELVRMEAQSAIVQLYGFEGLRFLDIIDTPISEWQQITLLRLLARMPGIQPEKIANWLGSANDSVRIFALKLAAEHHLHQLHDQVTPCLHHPHPHVRMQTVRCLKEIYTDATSGAMIQVYETQDIPCRLAILDILGAIGAPDNGSFLSRQLAEGEDMLKLGAARALIQMGDPGLKHLDEFPLSGEYPWNEIFQQAKTEQTA
jgi:hypothetical protein